MRVATELLLSWLMGALTLPAAALWALVCLPGESVQRTLEEALALAGEPVMVAGFIAAGGFFGIGMWLLFDAHWLVGGYRVQG